MNVVLIGSWHLGSVTGVCLAEAGHNVYLWDQNPKVAEFWRKGTPPIHEPGLVELTEKHWNKNLNWTDSLERLTPETQWVWVTYDTPINERDELMFDSVEEGLDAVLSSGIGERTNFLLNSQCPVGTSQRFRKKIMKAFPQWKGHMVYLPENLRVGEAIKSFQNPDRIVLGIDDFSEKSNLVSDFQKMIGQFSVSPQIPINVMSLESAEMVKHALNSFLATCVVFANELSDICENKGANAWDVVASLKQDSRVGPKAFLRPGLGFAGGTLARDVITLSQLRDREANHNFFNRLYEINFLRNEWISEQLINKLGDLKKKKIVLLGVTYKPGTSIVRRSPTLDISRLLASKGAVCVAIDPVADLKDLSSAEKNNLSFTMEKDPKVALKNADACIIITEWPQFRELDWTSIKLLMNRPLLIDTKNFFGDKDRSKIADYDYIVPGEPR